MEIRKNVSLQSLNWFKTGGIAASYCEPVTLENFQEALRFAGTENQPTFFLGAGANILISDQGFNGLVVHPCNPDLRILQETSRDDTIHLRAGAGVGIQQLIDYCLDHNLTGLEPFSGIPGTVGGAVYINLHYFEHLLSDFFISGRVLHRQSGELKEVDQEWFRFGYDQSRLHDGEYLLYDAVFEVKPSSELETMYAKGRRDEIIRHRNRRYPESHTCGSFFRNFHPEEVTLTVGDKKMIYIGYYLDTLGIKGRLEVGDAIVSSKHANMIVNQGNATTSEIIDLVRRMQQMVLDEYGILPQPECQLVGFEDYPLLTK